MVKTLPNVKYSRLADNGVGRSDDMHFDEQDLGDYRIFAGALEAPQGRGYLAAMVVQRIQGLEGGPREALREENMACGHRWSSPKEALAYAIKKAQVAIRDHSHMLIC
jgi:hypothetical protein